MLGACISVSVCGRNNGRKHNPICLKLGTNVYILREISCVIFCEHFLNSAQAELHKSISMQYGQWSESLVRRLKYV